jgi:hypothetical protein
MNKLSYLAHKNQLVNVMLFREIIVVYFGNLRNKFTLWAE